MRDIQELIIDNDKQRLEAETKQAQQENRERMLNLGTSVIGIQMKSTLLSLFYRGLNDSR